MRDLRVGERLQTAAGAVTIAALERVRGSHRVYNLEVGVDHEYLVGRSRVRAHNGGCGDAAVHYRKNPDGSAHFTVEVNAGGELRETHQIITSGRKTQVFEVAPGDFKGQRPVASKTFKLSDPAAARQRQQDQVDWGEDRRWRRDGRNANSCATVVCDVVSAGGGDLPSKPEQAHDALFKLFGL